MAAQVRPKHLYGYRGHHYAAWRGVKIGKYVWGVYKVFASKASAEKSLRSFKMWGGQKPIAASRMVKTVRGWAVVQLSPHGPYRTRSDNPNLYLTD